MKKISVLKQSRKLYKEMQADTEENRLKKKISVLISDSFKRESERNEEVAKKQRIKVMEQLESDAQALNRWFKK